MLLVFLLGITIYQRFQINRLPTEYLFDVETEHFSLKKVGLVGYAESTYVDGGYYLEKENEEYEFDGISMVATINSKHLFSFSQADDPFTLPDSANNHYYFGYFGYLTDVKLRPDDEIAIIAHYEVNGEKVTFETSLPLNTLKKPFTSDSSFQLPAR